MTVPRHARLLLGFVLVGALAAGGCSSARDVGTGSVIRSYPQPLGRQYVGERLCSEVRIGQGYSWGTDTLTDHAKGPLRVTGFHLRDAAGMRVLGEDVLALKPAMSIMGDLHQYPPDLNVLIYGGLWESAWRTRHPIRGFVMRPGQRYNLVVGLRLAAQVGHFSGFEVDYVDASGQHYAFGVPSALELRPAHCS